MRTDFLSSEGMGRDSIEARPDWTTYFLNIAEVVASRSTCLRRHVGAVIARGNHILSTGYNGAPRGVPHCTQEGCLRLRLAVPSGERHELCRGSHAELNAVVQAAQTGTPTLGATLFTTHEPCSLCTKALINAGIVCVFYITPYEDTVARELRSQAGLEIHRWEAPKAVLTPSFNKEGIS